MENKEKVLNLNIKAVQQTLNEMRKKIEDQQTRISGLVSTVSTMQGELNSINQRVAIQQAKSFGNGSTT